MHITQQIHDKSHIRGAATRAPRVKTGAFNKQKHIQLTKQVISNTLISEGQSDI